MKHLLWPALALAFVVFLLAVAYVPLEIRVGMGADGERWHMRMRLAPPWGFPRLAMRTGWKALWPRGRGAPSANGGGGGGRAGRRHDPSLEERWRAAKRLWMTIHVDGAHLRLEAGLGDAAATAVACGVLWALASTLVASLPDLPAERARVRVAPTYGGARLRGSLAVCAHLAVWQAAWVALALFWPPG